MPPRPSPRKPRTTPTVAPAPANAARSPGPKPVHRNEVSVVGRLAAHAEIRDLPSGDQVVVWRLVVERDGPPVTGRPHLDTLECAAWLPRLRRSALSWSAGDIIEVKGALRRRFWRNAVAVNSRYEIETTQARRVARPIAG